jgi:hypothetical protein
MWYWRNQGGRQQAPAAHGCHAGRTDSPVWPHRQAAIARARQLTKPRDQIGRDRGLSQLLTLTRMFVQWRFPSRVFRSLSVLSLVLVWMLFR